MGKVNEILEGWGNLIIRPGYNSEVVEKRLLICDGCPTRSGNTCDTAKGGCGCIIPAIVRVKAKECIQNKW
jgi:hypothetical protein